MATNVILPALGMSQDTGKIVQWLKAEGEQVTKGEPLVEIETDKATVEIEAPATGTLAHVTCAAGDEVPVGQVIALVFAAEEALTTNEARKPAQTPAPQSFQASVNPVVHQAAPTLSFGNGSSKATPQTAIAASSLASRMAAEHNLDLSQIKSSGKRIQKADVLAYLQNQQKDETLKIVPRLTLASPKARRLAAEQGKTLSTIKGTGPGGAVIAADVLRASVVQTPVAPTTFSTVVPTTEETTSHELEVSNIWRIMAERTSQSWTTIPHFFLEREVNVSRLMAWREQLLKRSSEKITYTDLLVKLVAATLRLHPRMNASWQAGNIVLQHDIHVGLAVAIDEGLVVPVIHQSDKLQIVEIAQQRKELVSRAQSGKLRPQDIQNGTFTISNLGMYNVDAFHAIINQPQAAILAVGRIAERVVPLNGQPAIQPMMVLTLSCDHRTIDGARAAQFLATLAELIEEPLGLLA